MTKAVLSLGGSVINDGTINTVFLASLRRLSAADCAIVTGGGRTARNYITAARALGLSEYDGDLLGIKATELNALFISLILDWPLAKDLEEARRLKSGFVMGGTIPGISTDMDSVLVAEAVGAKRMVNITRIGRLYDREPTLPEAKPLKALTYEEMERMAYEHDQRMAGTHFPVDLVAVRLAKRAHIEIHVVGPDIDEIEHAIKGLKHNGTVIGRHRPSE